MPVKEGIILETLAPLYSLLTIYIFGEGGMPDVRQSSGGPHQLYLMSSRLENFSKMNKRGVQKRLGFGKIFLKLMSLPPPLYLEPWSRQQSCFPMPDTHMKKV